MTIGTYSGDADADGDGFSACLEIIHVVWLKIVLDGLDGIDYFNTEFRCG
jgi:hypothetical protein